MNEYYVRFIFTRLFNPLIWMNDDLLQLRKLKIEAQKDVRYSLLSTKSSMDRIDRKDRS